MQRTQVLLPYQAGPHRGVALEWVLQRYARTFPLTDVQLAMHSGPWCKALAVGPAVQRAAADIVVVADADVWTDGLLPAVMAVRAGAAWAVPHQLVHRLTQEATTQVLHGAEWRTQAVEERPYMGLAGGGIVVAQREVLAACPLDPRFRGWGCEDEAWNFALTTLHGDPWRGEADMVHLWHPPQQRLTRRVGSQPSRALRRRYAKALGDPAIMRALVQEAHDAY